ncbi:hypothetical protein BC938DRAFT_480267, partial [Jimgerdemannia flammicorona]
MWKHSSSLRLSISIRKQLGSNVVFADCSFPWESVIRALLFWRVVRPVASFVHFFPLFCSCLLCGNVYHHLVCFENNFCSPVDSPSRVLFLVCLHSLPRICKTLFFLRLASLFFNVACSATVWFRGPLPLTFLYVRIFGTTGSEYNGSMSEWEGYSGYSVCMMDVSAVWTVTVFVTVLRAYK